MICALVNDNMVVAVATISSDEEFIQIGKVYSNIIDVTDFNPMPQAGWLFDGSALSPGPGMADTTVRKITKLGLRQRFTFSELCALTAASGSYVPVAALMGNLNVANYVDLNRADTKGGIQLLVSLGLITQQRASEILNAPINSEERYKGTE